MKTEEKTKILILCDYYLPGYKSGGGMRTIVNIVERFKEQFDFSIITRDHDGKLDKKPYQGVNIDGWNAVKDTKVFYISAENFKIGRLSRLITQIEPEAIYVNSFFSSFAVCTLLLRKAGRLPTGKIIIAPCGELSAHALALKSAKKKLFLKLSGAFGLYENIVWKASSPIEKEEIEKYKGIGGKIFVAPDLPPQTPARNFKIEQKPEKKKGAAKMVFLSRFVRIKNFKWLLNYLDDVKGKLQIDVIGPIEQNDYWNECLQIIDKLPGNIKIEAKGIVPYEQVYRKLLGYHFFILPTLSENFGHALLEALAAGCPLIVSDRTPWRNLQAKKIGWDIALENPRRWIEILNHCIDLDDKSYRKMARSAEKFAVERMSSLKTGEDTLRMFESTLKNAR